MSTNKLANNNCWLFRVLKVHSELSGFLASELEAEKDPKFWHDEKDFEEATDIKGPEEAEDFDENDLEEPNDEEQDALSEGK